VIEHRLTAAEIAKACGLFVARKHGLEGKFNVCLVPEVRGDVLTAAHVTLEAREQHAPSLDYAIAEVKP